MTSATTSNKDWDEGQVTGNHGEFDYWVVKIDSEGELEWQKCFGGANYELGYGIIETSDGGYAMVGGSPSKDGQVTGNHGAWDVWVVKMNAKGKLLWQKSLGGSQYDAGYAIVEAQDKGLIILGETYSDDGDVSVNKGDDVIWLVKLSGNSGGRDIRSLQRELPHRSIGSDDSP